MPIHISRTDNYAIFILLIKLRNNLHKYYAFDTLAVDLRCALCLFN